MRSVHLATMMISLCGATPLVYANPADSTAPVASPPRSLMYSVESRLLLIHGNPDWERWTRAHANAYEFHEGAGKVFGPIDATNFWPAHATALDFARVGFPGAADKDVVLLSSPRVTDILDRRAHLHDTDHVPTQFKLFMRSSVDPAAKFSDMRNVLQSLDALHDALSLTPGKSPGDYKEAKAMIVCANYDTDENRDILIPPPNKLDGVMAINEARSTETPGVYRLDQELLIHAMELKRARGTWKSGPEIVRGQFRCEYNVKDGSTAAFLLPVAKDKFLVVVATFNLVDSSGNRNYFDESGRVTTFAYPHRISISPPPGTAPARVP